MKQTDEKTVIFVCTGNTCRSPMAEAIFRYEVKRRGLAVFVCSAGTDAAQERGMNVNSLRTLAAHGLSIDNFTPTQLTAELLADAFAVICMTERHKELVSYHYERLVGSLEKTAQAVYAFSDFCGYSIPDPYGHPIECYERTYQALAGGMSTIIEKLFNETPSGKEPETQAEPPKKRRGRPRKNPEMATKAKA